MTALIDMRDVTKTYGAFTALNDVTLSLSDTSPSMTAVAGESGSGKTTLARMMLGFINPSHGQVLYQGKDVAKMSGAEQRQFRPAEDADLGDEPRPRRSDDVGHAVAVDVGRHCPRAAAEARAARGAERQERNQLGVSHRVVDVHLRPRPRVGPDRQ